MLHAAVQFKRKPDAASKWKKQVWNIKPENMKEHLVWNIKPENRKEHFRHTRLRYPAVVVKYEVRSGNDENANTVVETPRTWRFHTCCWSPSRSLFDVKIKVVVDMAGQVVI